MYEKKVNNDLKTQENFFLKVKFISGEVKALEIKGQKGQKFILTTKGCIESSDSESIIPKERKSFTRLEGQKDFTQQGRIILCGVSSFEIVE